MTKANRREAKTIAFHSLNLTTDGRNTPAVIAKTINQAKNLLSVGYTVDEICESIDHIVSRGIVMYSFGYLNTCIGDVLKQINELKEAERLKEEVRQLLLKQTEEQGEVKLDVESTERNRSKAARFGTKSGFREKHHLDMFEGD